MLGNSLNPSKDSDARAYIAAIDTRMRYAQIPTSKFHDVVSTTLIGNANKWYYLNIKGILDWETFCRKFVVFDPSRTDVQWMGEMQGTFQGANDPAVDFIIKMQTNFDSLTNQVPESAQTEQIVLNMLPSFVGMLLTKIAEKDF